MPAGFTAWVIVSVGSELAAGILAFALTWTASGHGPQVASAVLTLAIAPAVLLGLLGGAVADRYGARRIMITGTAALIMISVGLAVAVGAAGPLPGVLLTTAALIGVVSAFYRPAVGVFPRLFAADDQLGTAMARVGVANQLARTAAPPLGGILIGALALSGVAVINVIGCALMLIALLLITPPRAQAPAPEAVTLRGIASGVATAFSTRGVGTLLGAVTIVAGAVIPAVILGVPLAARERGWSAAEAGIIEAGWIAGGILVGAWFGIRGTIRRAWIPMAIGPAIVASGLLTLALTPLWPVAALGTVIVGIGVVVFTAHVFPTYILLAPPDMLSRFQSLLILMQQAPQLLVFPVIGAVVAARGSAPMLAGAGAVALIAAALVAVDHGLREARPGAT